MLQDKKAHCYPYKNLLKPKIGLLGGSFNPAHLGHIAVSKAAIQILGLDEVWWLVSPQNPLKPRRDMADFETRMADARRITKPYPFIKVSDFELRIGHCHTQKTLCSLKQHSPKTVKFIFLIGSDNLCQLSKWHRFEDILSLMPIAIMPRDPDDYRARLGKIQNQLAKKSFYGKILRQLINQKPPALGFMQIRKNKLRASFIRKNLYNAKNSLKI